MMVVIFLVAHTSCIRCPQSWPMAALTMGEQRHCIVLRGDDETRPVDSSRTMLLRSVSQLSLSDVLDLFLLGWVILYMRSRCLNARMRATSLCELMSCCLPRSGSMRRLGVLTREMSCTCAHLPTQPAGQGPKL